MTASTYDTDDARWAAVERRDRSADGAFYTGVKTTGVYCLPSCAGRPMRKNVSFFTSREAARATGLRACKRCKPDEFTGRETIRYATTETPLGVVLVAQSGAGVCSITLGDEASGLVEALRRRFPDAILSEAAAELAATLDRVKTLLDEPGARFDLPLDLRGTAFQRAVWQGLRAIPAGRTASYAELARSVGRPEAMRAVAQACGANPVAVVVPCHRVIRADGRLSGYRWGVERKRALLAMEAAA